MTDEIRVEQIEIKVAGTALSHEIMDKLLEAEIDTTLYLPSMFVLRFHDDDLALVDGSSFNLGAEVEISFGNRENTDQFSVVMKGEITAIEPEFKEDFTATLTIRGYDKRHRLNRETKIRAFVQSKDSDIVSKIVSEAGLSAQVDATTGIRDHVFQSNQTDLAFIHHLADRNGYEIYFDGTTLNFRKQSTSRTEVTLEWGNTLRRFHPHLSVSRQVNKVTVKGWDPVKKQAITGQATSSTTHPAIGYGKSGGSALTAAFSAAEHIEVHHNVASQSEANNIAQAILNEINNGFIEAEGEAYGNPNIIAGKKVKIEGAGTKFSGTYVVTSARHIYSAHTGYDTDFTVEGAKTFTMADLSRIATGSKRAGNLWEGVVPAIVTNNNNTEKQMGHIKVKFPWLDDKLESGWARITGIGAGASRGLFWLPEVNDEVLVAFEHGDFNRPYIIGSLWNGTDAPPETISTAVKNSKVETRTIKTREGHVIRLVDDSSGQKIEIIDAKQNTEITLDTQNKKITIKSKGDLELNATGDITLSGKNVNVSSTSGNIAVNSKANLELKGGGMGKLETTGMLDVKSSAILTVKGSMVNIN